MKLTQEIIDTMQNQRPIPIATCSVNDTGKLIPNLIYVSFIKPYDDETIIIADNKFFKTRINLLNNPEMAITVYNPLTNLSYQIKGDVTIYEEGEIFNKAVEWVQGRKSHIMPKAIILVHVREVYCKNKKMIYNKEGNLEFV